MGFFRELLLLILFSTGLIAGSCNNMATTPQVGQKVLLQKNRAFDKNLFTLATGTLPISRDISVGYKGLVAPYTLSKPQFLYVILTTLFVTCLVIADVIGVKLFELKLPFSIFGLTSVEHTCGMLTFPVTFLLGDTINEYYGAKATRQTVYLGLAMSIFVFVVMNIAQALPYLDKPFNVSKNCFDAIFGSAR